MTTFTEANQVVHPVETQWHYKCLQPAGYQALTKEATGMVRSYEYFHPITGSRIVCTTGASADYWRDQTFGDGGYWSSLQPHIEKLASEYNC